MYRYIDCISKVDILLLRLSAMFFWLHDAALTVIQSVVNAYVSVIVWYAGTEVLLKVESCTHMAGMIWYKDTVLSVQEFPLWR